MNNRAVPGALGVGAIRIRSSCAEDVPAMVAILAACSQAAGWSEEALSTLSSSGYQSWTAERDSQVAGFLIGRIAPSEFEIMNLAVAPEQRRQGIARALLIAAVDFAREQRATRAYLEVRASNMAAIGLYQRHGFSECGRRARYYADPVEDALILSKTLQTCDT